MNEAEPKKHWRTPKRKNVRQKNASQSYIITVGWTKLLSASSGILASLAKESRGNCIHF